MPDQGLIFYDITDPAVPQQMGSLPGLGDAIILQQRTDGMLVAGSETVLSFIDVADPAAPELLGSLALDGGLLDMAQAASGPCLVIAKSGVGNLLQCVGGFPEAPAVTAEVPVASYFRKLAACPDADLCCVADGGFLSFFDCGATLTPRGSVSLTQILPSGYFPQSKTISRVSWGPGGWWVSVACSIWGSPDEAPSYRDYCGMIDAADPDAPTVTGLVLVSDRSDS